MGLVRSHKANKLQYKAHGQAFQVPTYSNNRVILSAKHVEELRNFPESKLSLAAASYEVSLICTTAF